MAALTSRRRVCTIVAQVCEGRTAEVLSGKHEVYESFLKDVDVFKTFDASEISQVAAVLEPMEFEMGQNVVTQGDQGDAVYIIEDGEAIAVKDGVPLMKYKPRMYFGEQALVYECPRAADVRASTKILRVAKLTRKNFHKLLGKHEQVIAEYLFRERAQAPNSAATTEGANWKQFQEDWSMVKRVSGALKSVVSTDFQQIQGLGERIEEPVADDPLTLRSLAQLRRNWLDINPVVQFYMKAVASGKWVESPISFIHCADFDENFVLGSPLFDRKAIDGFWGCGGIIQRLGYWKGFWNEKDVSAHIVLNMLPQVPTQTIASPSIVTCFVDYLLTDSCMIGVEEGTSLPFTAWLHATPILPVPVNHTLVLRTRVKKREQKKSGLKLMFIGAMLVGGPTADSEEELFMEFEALFIQPLQMVMDVRSMRSLQTDDLEGSRGRCLEMNQEFVAEHKDGLALLERLRAQYGAAIDRIRCPNDPGTLLCKYPDVANLEEGWLRHDPIFIKHPGLLKNPPMEPLEYTLSLDGNVLLRFARPLFPDAMVGLGDDANGEVSLVGAVQFLTTSEGPPGWTFGGMAYAVLMIFMEQAFVVLAEGAKASRTMHEFNYGVSRSGHTCAGLQVKVQYRRTVPMMTSLVLMAGVCEDKKLRATLLSVDGHITYQEAECELPVL